MLRNASLVAAGLVATVASLQSATSSLPLADGGRLVFVHPSSWTSKVSDTSEGPTLKLRPHDGTADFRVLITPLPLAKNSKLHDMDELERSVRERGEDMLSTATQKEVTLTRVDGSQARGFFFHLTDRKPEQGPGDYRELNHGALTLGPYLLSVTILTHPGDDATVKDALHMLAGASYQAAEP